MPVSWQAGLSCQFLSKHVDRVHSSPDLRVPGDQPLLDSLHPAGGQPRPPLASPPLSLQRPPPRVGEAPAQPEPPRPGRLGLL